MSGFQNFEPAMGGKWLGVLKEAAPGMSRVAVVFGSDTAVNTEFLRAAEAVAPSLGVQVTWSMYRRPKVVTASRPG